MTRTKIVATIGPSSNKPEIIRRMLHAGMNVARINFSHGDHETHTQTVQMLREIAQQENKVLAILGDLQGPKIRLGRFEPFEVQEGQPITLSCDLNDPETLPLPHPELVRVVQPGSKLVLGDGEMELRIVGKSFPRLQCVVMYNGKLEPRKGVNTPGTTLPISSISDKDRADLRLVCGLDLDYVALSFVRSAHDILELRFLMKEYGNPNIAIIAKIEKFEAINNLQAIADTADGLMVARGDLGLDLPTEQIPLLQKRIIKVGNELGKPVITATQMLQSMVEHPRPTRAEASDVANAVLDGTDAVMLSNETAAGRYPVESVEMMKSIANMMEEEFPYETWRQRRVQIASLGRISEAISTASCSIAERINAHAIVTSTMSGYTAQQIARHRSPVPVVAVSPLAKTQRRLAMVWGVECILMKHVTNTDDMMVETLDAIKERGVKRGDFLVITSGVPFGQSGMTNLIQVHALE